MNNISTNYLLVGEEMTNKKKCSRCREMKLRTSEYFYSRKNNSKDGLQGVCKECKKPGQKRAQRTPDSRKQCSTCDKWFDRVPEFFYRRKESADGFRNSCKVCTNKWTENWKAENREKHLAGKRRYHQSTAGKRKDKEYRQRPDVIARRNELRNKRRTENKEEHQKKCREYVNKKRKQDEFYRVSSNVSRSLRAAMTKNKVLKKPSRTWDALPYTPQQLREHLESQFEDWMTWNNYGEWHIDHIYPQSKLPYNTIEHPNFVKCWSLNNLRPLCAIENRRKGNRTIITYDDGEQERYGLFSDEEKSEDENIQNETPTDN